MKRILACFVTAMVFLASVRNVRAAPLKKVWQIGILSMAWKPWHNQTEGFRESLKKMGYVEGKNLKFDVRLARGDSTQLPRLADELIRNKPDLLYCAMGPEAKACQMATRKIPIVFTQAGDPVKLGLIQSLARPGGNVTGVGSLRENLTAKRIEIFKQVVPSLRRVLVTYDHREAEEVEAVRLAREAAAQIGLTLVERPITNSLEIDAGFENLHEKGQDGVLIVQAGPNLNIPGRSLEAAALLKLPTMYPASLWVNFGALVSYGPNQYQQGRQAARLAHKILTGTSPQDIPVELPTKIELVINLKTAQRIGLRIPPEVLLRADKVIQ